MQPETDKKAKSSITLATSMSKPESEKAKTYGILFTLFNYEPLLSQLREYIDQETTYAIFGYEICPTTKTPHLQGYIHFKNARTYPNKELRKRIPGISDRLANGTALDNYNYCRKIRPEDPVPNEKWEEFGKMPTQGERTDWKQAVNDLHDGKDIISVVSEQPQLLPSIRALQTFKNLVNKPIHRDVKVILLVGSPGTGKTRWAWDNYPDLYSKPEGNWWDGYTDQKTILLDDYYGDIPYSQFLKVLDRYPLNLQIKGGFIAAQYTTVIITSNKSFTHWYPESNSAVKRRIHEIINLDNIIPDATNEETIYSQALQ